MCVFFFALCAIPPACVYISLPPASQGGPRWRSCWSGWRRQRGSRTKRSSCGCTESRLFFLNSWRWKIFSFSARSFDKVHVFVFFKHFFWVSSADYPRGVEERTPPPLPRIQTKLGRELLKPVLRCFADGLEKCRELAVRVVQRCGHVCGHLPLCGC